MEAYILKTMSMRSKILWAAGMMGLLAICYWLSRYAFFEYHGMKQWPTLLACVGWMSILIASVLGKKTISLATVLGYMAGFVLAMMFNTDGLDPGGGRTNNAWIIWGAVFICFVLIGIIGDYFYNLRRRP